MNGSSYSQQQACIGRLSSYCLCLHSFPSTPSSRRPQSWSTAEPWPLRYVSQHARLSANQAAQALTSLHNSSSPSRVLTPSLSPAQLAQRANMDQLRLQTRSRCDERTAVPLGCARRRLIGRRLRVQTRWTGLPGERWVGRPRPAARFERPPGQAFYQQRRAKRLEI